jgi:hypothetical protein
VPNPVRMGMAAQPVVARPMLHTMTKPMGSWRIVAAEPVGFHVGMRRMMLRPARAMLMVGMFAASDMVLIAVGLAGMLVTVAAPMFALGTLAFDPVLHVLRLPGTPTMWLPIVGARIGLRALSRLMLAVLFALGIVAARNRLLQCIVGMLPLAAGDMGAMIRLAIVMPTEPVAMLDGIVVPRVLFSPILVRVGIFMVMRRVMLESRRCRVVTVTMRGLTAAMALMVHLMVFGVTNFLGMSMAVRGMMPLMLLVLHVVAFPIGMAGVGRMELSGY